MSTASWPDSTPSSRFLDRRGEQICTAFEQAWQAGQRPSPGEYLAQVPPAARDALLRELVGLDIDYRRDAGEEPRWEDYRPWLPVECPAWLRDLLAGTIPAAAAPARLDKYEILEELGRGGMGIVYKARDESLKRLVALKMIRAGVQAEPSQRSRFQTEAQSVARLQHPHIVQIHEIGEHAGLPYLVLEYVDGGSLAARLAGTPLPLTEAVALVETLAQAMHIAHQHGIVHRDLKPANVLLSRDGVPKITDFGLARLLDGETGHTQTGTVLGTPSYMAPEQAAGQPAAVGPLADVYALGAILYETLTGRAPFIGASVLETLEQVRSREPLAPSSLRPKLPRDLETICLKCLRKEPGRRYASARDLAEDLARFRKGEPIRARPVGTPEKLARWCRRNPALAAVGAVALVALGVAVLTLLRIGQQQQLYQGRLDHQAAGLNFDQGVRLCEQGQFGEGMLWLARSLKGLPPSDKDLERVIRTNLASAGQLLTPLRSSLTHGDRVLAVAVSPDGKTALTGGRDSRARLWDLETGECRFTFQHGASIGTVAFSPDGRTVLTGSRDKQLRRWDAVTGQPLVPPLVHTYAVHAVACSADGRFILTGSGKDPGEAGEAHLWDARTGQLVRGPLACAGAVRAVALSADGGTVVTGGEDGLVRVWRGPGSCPLQIDTQDWVSLLALSPDGKSVAAGARSAVVQLWDAETGRPLHSLRNQGKAESMAFSRDGRLLFVGVGLGVSIGEVQSWDVATGQAAHPPLPVAGPVHCLGLQGDPPTLWAAAARAPTVRLWDINLETRLPAALPHSGSVKAAMFGKDDTQVLTVGPLPGAAETQAVTWDRNTRQPVHRFPLEDPVRGAAWSPDEHWLVTVTDKGKTATDTAKRALLWDATRAQPRPEKCYEAAEWLSVPGFTADSRACLLAGEEGKARVLDLDRFTVVRELPEHPAPVYGVACDRDGHIRATACRDGMLRLWDGGDGTRPRELPHPESVRCVVLSPDGKRVATGSEDWKARLWDPVTAQQVCKALGHAGTVRVVAFDAAGGRLLTGSDSGRIAGSGEARLWDVVTGLPLGPPLYHPQSVRIVAFSRSGDDFLTAGDEGPVRLWQTPVPLVAESERITCWVQVLTGLAFNADDSLNVLPAGPWRRLRERLAALGGPPE
jgi:WD40 repeat protein